MKAQHFAQLLIERKVTVDNLVSFLEKHNLLAMLPGVLGFLKHKEAQHLAHNTLVIETPFPLDDKSIKTVKRMAGNDLIEEVELVENKDVLAGYIARYKGKEYDASAKTIINNFINQ